ncbi:MAG TPA: leukotoxin LktA family filamentous adhesin, partial [Phycisphaerae bacterium]|nr:leukotoxin LktA family filamentous adhesin [Phycisphaerae bacterium]
MTPRDVSARQRTEQFYRGLWGRIRRRSRRTLHLAAAAAAGFSGVRITEAAPNLITPDGSTQTQLQVNGALTTITTKTISGSDAFNSFSNFQVSSGNTVDLIVPDSANYLVNLVHDSPVMIGGILNAYKNGQIGGNIVFADPSGMIVSSSGVINAGSLTITTPTPAFMNELLNQAGKVDPQAAAELIAGDEPLSSGAVINIAGRINALTSVNLSAAEVIAAKSSVLTVGDSAKLQDALFKATVNTTGLQQGAALAEDDGSIAIVASSDVDLAGNVHVGGAQGGNISVTAPKVTVESTAHIDASGADGGGNVFLGGNFHGNGPLTDAQQVSVASGAQITANATSNGDGGNVALWSINGTSFAGTIDAEGGPLGGNGGYVEVSAKTGLNFLGQVNTAAPMGQTGTLLLDPTELDITNDSSDPNSTISVSTLQGMGDTNIILSASDTITVGDSSNDTSTNLDLSSTLKTQTLTLEAGTGSGSGNITFNSGSSIETGGGNVVLDSGVNFSSSDGSGTTTLGSITTHGGSVTVNAADGVSLPAGTTINTTGTGSPGTIDFEVGQQLNSGIDVDLSQTLAITIDGTLNGGTITLDDNSLTNSVYNNNTTAIAEFSASTIAGSILGLAGEGVLAQDDSTVSIDSTATITGTDVTIESQTSEEASSPEYNISLSSFNPFPSSVIYGEVDATSAATIAKGATININSGGSLTVSATNNDTLDISAYTVIASTGSYTAATVSVGEADINASASIASGANINLSNNADVSVTALNQNSFSVSATAMANSQGV